MVDTGVGNPRWAWTLSWCFWCHRGSFGWAVPHGWWLAWCCSQFQWCLSLLSCSVFIWGHFIELIWDLLLAVRFTTSIRSSPPWEGTLLGSQVSPLVYHCCLPALFWRLEQLKLLDWIIILIDDLTSYLNLNSECVSHFSKRRRWLFLKGESGCIWIHIFVYYVVGKI